MPTDSQQKVQPLILFENFDEHGAPEGLRIYTDFC